MTATLYEHECPDWDGLKVSMETPEFWIGCMCVSKDGILDALKKAGYVNIQNMDVDIANCIQDSVQSLMNDVQNIVRQYTGANDACKGYRIDSIVLEETADTAIQNLEKLLGSPIQPWQRQVLTQVHSKKKISDE